ncbi:MAG: CPBP family intramembrane glutamic endopeptidase [Armatimonadota bacterium]
MGLKESESTDGIDSAISGDIQTKIAYSQMYLRKIIPTESLKSKSKSDNLDLSYAIRDYRESVILSPIPINIRKLIILDNSKLRQKTILSLSKLKNSKKVKKSTRINLPNEMVMWRDIYFSKDKSDPTKVAKYSAMISSMKLGWFEHLALADLYQSKGGQFGAADASRERSQAAHQAFKTMSMFAIVVIFLLLSGIAGLILLILYIVKISRRKSHIETVLQNRFRNMPEHEKSFISGYMLEAFLAYMLISLVVQIAVGGSVALFTPRGYEMNRLVSDFLNLSTYLIAGVWSILYLSVKIHKGGWDWSIIGLNKSTLGKDIAWGISGYTTTLPLMIFMIFVANSIEKTIPTPPNPVVPEILASTNLISRLILFFMVAVGAPIFEEIFFRGVLLTSLRARWGTLIAIGVSSIIFAFLHPFPGSFVPIFMLGAIFATLAYERSSLIPGMIAHSMNNTIIFIFLMLSIG